MSILPGFGGSRPAPVQAAPAPITREDPAVKEAREKQRQSELRRKGRKATILTGRDTEDNLGTVNRKALNDGGTGSGDAASGGLG